MKFISSVIVAMMIFYPATVSADVPPQEAVRIIVSDDATSPATPLQSLDDVSNHAFREFLSTVLEAMKQRFGDATIVSDKSEPPADNAVAFVRIPLVTSGDHILRLADTLAPLADGGCRIRSPWAEFSIKRTVPPRIRGTFFWNERQVLQDQAVLARLTTDGTAAREPLSRREFDTFAQEYAENEILQHSPRAGAQPPAVGAPPDLLWLLRYSPQTTILPFSHAVTSTLRDLLERLVADYSRLAIGMVSLCADGRQEKFEIENVREIKTRLGHRIRRIN